MTDKTFSYGFIRSNASMLTWREALWGYEHKLIDWRILKELAGDRLCDGSDAGEEVELAGLDAPDAYQAGELAKKLAAKESIEPAEDDQRVWLYLTLVELFERRNKIGDALAEVELVYADYNYPEEIESFVRFMPASDGYDPLQHTHEENVQRLFCKWEQYLIDQKILRGVINQPPP